MLVAVAVMIVITVVVVVIAVVVVMTGGRKGNAAEDLSELSFADDAELLFGGFGGVSVGQVVGDGYEAVGVCALVAVATDSGGDAIEGDLAVMADGAGDVADAVGCGRPGQIGDRVVTGGVVVDGVGNAEFETGLQDVGEAPGFGGGVEGPRLNSGVGL